jgi:hypothetical protein
MGQYVGGGLFWRRATIMSSGVEKHAALPLYTCRWCDSTAIPVAS